MAQVYNETSRSKIYQTLYHNGSYFIAILKKLSFI